MGQFYGRWLLERGDRRALGVEGSGDDTDRAVLAGGVDPLEDDQDGVLGLGVDAVLEVRQPGEVGRENLVGLLLLATEGFPAVELRQVHLLARLDARELAQAVVGLLLGHCRAPAAAIVGFTGHRNAGAGDRSGAGRAQGPGRRR